jgi:hypothetical protein
VDVNLNRKILNINFLPAFTEQLTSTFPNVFKTAPGALLEQGQNCTEMEISPQASISPSTPGKKNVAGVATSTFMRTKRSFSAHSL